MDWDERGITGNQGTYERLGRGGWRGMSGKGQGYGAGRTGGRMMTRRTVSDTSERHLCSIRPEVRREDKENIASYEGHIRSGS